MLTFGALLCFILCFGFIDENVGDQAKVVLTLSALAGDVFLLLAGYAPEVIS